MRARALSILLALLLALTVVGCAGDGGTVEPEVSPPVTGSQEPPTGETPSGGESTSAMLAPPGLYDQADGRVQALGTLTYRDAEGGFWAVVDTAVPDDADTAAVVAVILPDNDIAGSMESLRGEYVSIVGDREDRSYAAGPAIEGRTIEVVSDTIVE